jgi:uncharacterized protein
MIRLLWFFILTVALYWAVRGLISRGERKSRPGAGGEEMVRDPNCGVYLPRSSAISLQSRGEHLYFCSEECRKAYIDRVRGEVGVQE